MITADLVRERAEAHHDRAVGIRRHLHAHPELSFSEQETAQFVANELQRMEIPRTVGVGGHGVVAVIQGEGSNPAATRALRADMDALPIQEIEGRPYGSTRKGVMHACGHDGHTASLLSAAAILNDLRAHFGGSVKLIFQPAEEKAPGGAKPMIAEGVLENPKVNRVFGQHVNPHLPVGTVGFNHGLFMASVDDLSVTIHGKGGHAAKPHLTIDPITIAATIVTSLQQTVSRLANPLTPSVLTFGRIRGDGATNVIPDTVLLEGTFRTVDEKWREEALARIEESIRGICKARGAEVTLNVERGYPALVNDAETTKFARSRAVEYLGEENVVTLPTSMGGEDFAYYAQKRPACFYDLGVGNEERGIVHSLHTPRFDMDEEALKIGAGLLAWIALG